MGNEWVLRIVLRSHAHPQAIIEDDTKTVTLIYDGDVCELAMAAFDAGLSASTARCVPLIGPTERE
jgi:hypothetical protein